MVATVFTATGHNPWRRHGAALTWRGYQEKALAVFAEVRRHPGARRFHLVAPPGAGKTLLGLHMAERLGAPALALSPTAAIQSQWLDRLRTHWLPLDDTTLVLEPAPPAAPEPTPHPLALTAITYQRLSVRPSEEEACEPWHENVEAAVNALRAGGVRTVIVDECHHLGGHWGVVVERLLARLDDPFVIGLTATPIDTDDGPLARLLGKPNHEISLPSVVRTGDLAPFQDLCHLVAPDAEEQHSLDGNVAAFERLFSRLLSGHRNRFGLRMWCDEMAIAPRAPDGAAISSALELYERQPDLVAALSRFAVSRGNEPAAELPYVPDFYEELTFLDRLRLVAHYLAQALGQGQIDRELASEARAVLEPWGFHVQAGAVHARVGAMARTVGYSRQKLVGMTDILRTETRHMGQDLCAVVLTDYEFPPDGRGLSCLDAMDMLTSLEDLDELDPVMITGRSFLIDDDLWPRFEHAARAFMRRQGWQWSLAPEEEKGYLRIEASGQNWDARGRVALATHLLSTRATRCLIGTRALLGEGWDCERVNTLIDLTVVSAGVSVNQMRGRSLRLDPDDGAKVANNWDVLCLSPVGEAVDLERLVRKHAQLHGICDDGQVERGLGHVHPLFDHVTPARLLDEAAVFSKLMHRRASQRGAARARWRVGAPFSDREVEVLSFSPRSRSQPRSRGREAQTAQDAEVVLASTAKRSRRKLRVRLLLAGAGALGVGTAGIIAGVPLLTAAGLGLAATASWRALNLHKRLAPPSLEDELRALAGIVAALSEEPECTRVDLRERDDGSIRVLFEDCQASTAGACALALAELLGPVNRCRYLLIEPYEEKGARTPSVRAYEVPRAHASKKAARRLLELWHERREPGARLVYRSSAEGRELFAEHRHTRPLGGEETLRGVWS